MKKIPPILLLILFVLLTACGGNAQETPTAVPPEPTAKPVAEPTAEPTAVPEPTDEPAEAVAEAAGDAATDSGLPADFVAQLDEFLQAQIYSQGGDTFTTAPGVVLLVDTPDGRYLQAAGVASLEDGTPMQVGDRMEIGSNSKSFTIVLLMQLQEEGILSLDDPLSTWLPDWAAKIPNGDEMTLRQLAQHTSGIWDYGDPIIGQAATNPVHLEDYDSPEQLVQYALDNGTPDFAPGEEGQWKYSNTGYILLGMVIETASGEKLGDLYQSRIFDPLNLESAVFIEDVPEPHEIVDGYFWTDDGHELNTTKWNVSQGWAAGGLAMTAEDLSTYAKALSAGELFQDPDSLAQMLAFDPDGMIPYGLGVMDFNLIGIPGSWGHGGQTAGFQSLWFTDPETETTVVGLTNSANYSAFHFFQLAPLLTPGSNEETAVDSTTTAADSLPDDLTAQLDAFLVSQLYFEGGNPEGTAPGLVLLVDTPDGRYLQAFGVSNMEEGTPMLVDDRLEIGSNSKSMTVVLLMQLAEEGVLSLDDPLSKWLPEQAASLPNGDQMTLRQLAQHTTGVWDYGDDIIGAGASDPAKLEEAYTPAEIVQFAADNGTPDFAPGEELQWKYSNTGYILLGMVIEAASGQNIGDLYQSRIFDPLGLESAIFLESVPEADQITHGYWWEDGQRIDTTSWNVSQGWAAGGNAMTAADLAVYGKALAAGELFQNPDTLNEMLTFDPNALLVDGTPYGLGLMDFTGDGTYWGHSGQTIGFASLWYTNPDKEIVVVVLTNSASYNVYSFLNVTNILEGDGALPVGPATLLPIGGLLPTTWEWVHFVNPADIIDIDETDGLELVIAKDQSVTINSSDCGSASGAYTVDGVNNIDFDLDDSGITCAADSLPGQFVGYLNNATSWRFNNGGLFVQLPTDGGVMIFEAKSESDE